MINSKGPVCSRIRDLFACVLQINVCRTDNAFPSGEGGCPNGQTEEVCVQYNFAENTAKRYFYYTSPAPPFGGTPFIMRDCLRQSFIRWASPLSKGEGLKRCDKLKFEISQYKKPGR